MDNRDNTGRSAFMKACETGRREVVDYLLAKGASVNVEDLRHRTPLHVASENGHQDIVTILLDREAELDVQDCYTGAELCFLIRGKDKGKYPASTVIFFLKKMIIQAFVPVHHYLVCYHSTCETSDASVNALFHLCNRSQSMALCGGETQCGSHFPAEDTCRAS